MSRVVATKHRKKSPSQRRWPSYEGELKAMRDNVVDFGNLIIVADESWSATHDAEVEACAKDGRPAPSAPIKIAFFCDAETAIENWKQPFTPQEVENYHLSAKLIRI